ncbi:MAG TPA: hypothetical protein ENH84_00070, partial [Phycisphaerae bacterium]|nr:hypothetical protein [Phycisphaerae bacterium]
MTKKQKAERLLELAQAAGFTSLTEPEHEMLSAAAQGSEADCGEPITDPLTWEELPRTENELAKIRQLKAELLQAWRKGHLPSAEKRQVPPEVEKSIQKLLATELPQPAKLAELRREKEDLQRRLEEKPAIRVELLRWICVTNEAKELVDPMGVQVRGARFDGAINLAFADVPFPLALFRCAVPKGLDFTDARLVALNLQGSSVGGISADGVEVKGSMFLRDGFCSRGEVSLLGAQIGG